MADLSFLETDSSKIYETVVTSLEKGVGEPLYPGDERRIFGDALVAVFVAAFTQANEACKRKMLQYASGTALDALGARLECDRLQPESATTVLRFSVKTMMNNNIIIPKGTRVSTNDDVYFQTVETSVLQAGTVYVDVDAESCEPGSKYNGYMQGSINQIVDIVPFIDSVKNITESIEGDDGEPYPEDDGGVGDDHYRERIRLAPTALSVAGPGDAYKFHAKSADSSISDVSVFTENAGEVTIVPILKGGIIPSDDIIQKVLEKCSADSVRPMTDKVIVQKPEQISYDIDITYYTTIKDETDCVEAIEGINGAINQYIEWQDTEMGRSINPDKIRSLCLNPNNGIGCTRLEVRSPAYEELKPTQVAKFGLLTVNHVKE